MWQIPLDTLYDANQKPIFSAPPGQMYERLVLNDYDSTHMVRIFGTRNLISRDDYLQYMEGK